MTKGKLSIIIIILNIKRMGVVATAAGAVGAATFNPPLAEYGVFVMNYIKQVIYE